MCTPWSLETRPRSKVLAKTQVVGFPELLREVLTLAKMLRDLMIGRHIVTLSHYKIDTPCNLSRNLCHIYGGPLGTRLFRRKSHSFCVLEVVFLNNRAFPYKFAAFA